MQYRLFKSENVKKKYMISKSIDTSNNAGQTSASFTWAIVTPSQYTQQITRNLVSRGCATDGGTTSSVIQFIHGIQQLVQFIQHTTLPGSTAASLAAPLNQAVTRLTDDNSNNDVAVCNGMNSFVAQVSSYLTQAQISPTIASQLIQQAQAIT
jgi:hypothetical protein